jgi:hypothetical protein
MTYRRATGRSRQLAMSHSFGLRVVRDDSVIFRQPESLASSE